MRRSEIIFLEWEQIHWGDENSRYIDLYNTKTADHRRVFLSLPAQEIIQELAAKTENTSGRIFKTSINAFERVFRLSVLRLGLDGKVTFHMARKTAITNLFKTSPANSILLSELFGFKEPEKLQLYHQEEVNDKSEKSNLKMIGHKSGRITLKSYMTLIKAE
jgi:integrase